MSQITLNLPDKVAAELAAAGREMNQSPEAFVQELLSEALRARSLRGQESKLATADARVAEKRPSVWDVFGKAPTQRSALDIDAQVREERKAWGER